MAFHIRRLILLAPLLLGCAAGSHYEAVPPPPPLPPPPPAEPPPQAGPPAADPELTSPMPANSSQAARPAADTTDSMRPSDAGPPLPSLPSQAPRYAPAPNADAPAPSQWVRSYPDGQWVYTNDYGWIWVPAGSMTTAVDTVPYAYLYTPRHGWTWYVSPWGWGGYHYGGWVTHPWHPSGWRHPWVAHPRVVIRLGRGHHHR